MRDAGRIGFDIKGSYDSEMKYEFLDVVYYQNSSYVAKKETIGNAPADNNEFWQILARGESSGGDADASDMSVKFEQSANMENILTGEKLSKIFGKLKKWFSVFPSTDLFGKINNLSDFNQINNTYRFWNIGSIDAAYAAELGIERNVGDFKCLLLSYNGDGETYRFGNLILSSPRLNNDYYLVRMWEGAPHVTYHKAEVPSLTNNLLATAPGTALDAAVGPGIDSRITANTNAIDQLNSDLQKQSIKYIDKNIQLNEITWIVSQNGKYYSPLQLDIPQDAILLGVSMCRWGGLKDNDHLYGYLTSNNGECGIASNVNSFYAGAYVNLMFTYIV